MPAGDALGRRGCAVRGTPRKLINLRPLMEGELHRALAEHEFVLHYQPQIDRANRCIGVEALIRWRNPTRGLVAPADFIPLAEECGLIQPIGRWVVEQAWECLAA